MYTFKLFIDPQTFVPVYAISRKGQLLKTVFELELAQDAIALGFITSDLLAERLVDEIEQELGATISGAEAAELINWVKGHFAHPLATEEELNTIDVDPSES